MNELGVYYYGDVNILEFFDRTSESYTNREHENYFDNLKEELSELYTTGLCNPEVYQEKLQNSRKYKSK